ncbi:MAG TPA: dTDP-4-dehydrorhamnose reductase [Dehalococcoidia bacterium]|nr:dTDP-4-dehydrorhamnose reductase [Dehalococcoidia bacterium]
MRILITGGRGQLGRSLARALAAHAVAAPGHDELDVADEASVRAAFERARPDIIIHAAALTDTNRCEREPDAADAVNARGTERVARACAAAGARMIAVSTNEVYDGAKRTPYTEDDATAPLNAYGRSKLRGEELARAALDDLLVVRTSWLYGAGHLNFAEKVLAAAGSGRALSFVADETAAPTYTDDLASAIAALIEKRAPAGVYHLANEGEASRWEWATEVLRLAGRDVPVRRVTTAELRANGYSGPAKPPYSVLANTRAAALGVTLRPWREALADYMRQRAAAATA